MSCPLLIQPASAGRISGGYLYNRRMAECGAWRLIDLQADSEHPDYQQPEDWPERLDADPDQWVVVDSLWLTPQHWAGVRALRAEGLQVAALLHSLPSMLAAADAGKIPARVPSEFEATALAELDCVLTVGPYYAECLQGISVDVKVLEAGMDDEFYCAPKSRAAGEPCRLVSLGAVTQLKGFGDVLEALESNPPQGDYTWKVVGSLTAEPEWSKRLLERAKDNPRVEFLGQLPHALARQQLQDAHALVMPSHSENYPLVVLEAIAACVPVVGYRVGAAQQMLGDQACGLLGVVGDTRDLGRNLKAFVDNEPNRYEFAQRAWRAHCRVVSWPEAAAQVEEALG